MKKLIFLFLILPIGLLAQTKLDPIMIKPGMLTVTELHVANENSKIYIDAEGNLVLRDSQAGEKKLSELVTVDVQSNETLTGTGTGLDPLGVNTTSIATKTDLDNYWSKSELTNTEKQRINDIGNALQFQGVSISSLSPTDGKIWVFRSGSWILEDKPLPSGAPAWGEITGTLSGQTDLQNALDGKQATLTGNEPIFSNWDKDASDDFSGDYNDLLNRSAIPSSLSELADDPNHRTVTDAEKANWNSKLSAEVDGSVTNELQNLSLTGNNLSISDGNTVDLSTITGANSTTHLSYTASATNGTVNSSTGTDATIPLANATNAGLMPPADYSKLSGISSSADRYYDWDLFVEGTHEANVTKGRNVDFRGTGGISINHSGDILTFDGSGISGGTTYIEGNGIDITGNTINLDINGITYTETSVSSSDLVAIYEQSSNRVEKASLYNVIGDVIGAGTGLSKAGATLSVTPNSIGASQLNVSGNGTNGQYLVSDGDGSFSWTNSGGGDGYINNATFTGGNLTLTGTGSASASVNLDGRYAMLNGSSTEEFSANGINLYQNKIHRANNQYISLSASGTSSTVALNNTRIDVLGSNDVYITAGSVGGTRIIVNSNGTIRLEGQVTGTSTFTATNFILSSDRRLKDNIQSIKLQNISSVPLMQFNLRKDSCSTTRYGVIAQDLKEVAPEMVSEDEDGYLKVSYIDFLIARLAGLEAKIEKLEKQVKSLNHEK